MLRGELRGNSDPVFAKGAHSHGRSQRYVTHNKSRQCGREWNGMENGSSRESLSATFLGREPKKINKKREAEMRQEDEDEDRYVRLKVRSVREIDGENDDNLLDFTSPSYKKAVLVLSIKPTNVVSLRPYDDKRYKGRRQENFVRTDPVYDAWLLRNGHERQQFPFKDFLEMYPRARCLVEDGEGEEPYSPAEDDNAYLLSQ